mmetsp:Transcript_4671/g.13163  ORF Transcript_4671/g.13163 Transcript_4671/m.13163 type:complete len:236 (+) Transcript_4671:450-1157(+)
MDPPRHRRRGLKMAAVAGAAEEEEEERGRTPQNRPAATPLRRLPLHPVAMQKRQNRPAATPPRPAELNRAAMQRRPRRRGAILTPRPKPTPPPRRSSRASWSLVDSKFPRAPSFPNAPSSSSAEALRPRTTKTTTKSPIVSSSTPSSGAIPPEARTPAGRTIRPPQTSIPTRPRTRNCPACSNAVTSSPTRLDSPRSSVYSSARSPNPAFGTWCVDSAPSSRIRDGRRTRWSWGR